ncbi:uncharacterized protein LOC111284113 [Durio zibethinus]|uniref:Uncharacterized protein LOC111284113 n=1 Tax=Durio zibethinus TaxID=66656 RepID=A0A6P5XK75_DURZI|nr:uncharacterized protein LOC111284113 [Durio zibethinus]
MIGRTNIEGLKSNVTLNAWLPQANYPCGKFFDTSSFKFRRFKGLIGHGFMMCHPQPNSPPDNVFHPDQSVEADLGSKRKGRALCPIHGISGNNIKSSGISNFAWRLPFILHLSNHFTKSD